jgi:hypothetical protein
VSATVENPAFANAPTLENIVDAIRQGRMARAELIELEADLVIGLVKAAGVLTVMPNAMLPIAPPLLMVHPDVYQRVQQKMREVAT